MPSVKFVKFEPVDGTVTYSFEPTAVKELSNEGKTYRIDKMIPVADLAHRKSATIFGKAHSDDGVYWFKSTLSKLETTSSGTHHTDVLASECYLQSTSSPFLVLVKDVLFVKVLTEPEPEEEIVREIVIMPYYETALNQYLIETDNVSIEDKARLMTQAILALRDLVRAGAQAHRDITMDQYMIHLDAQNKPHVRLTDFTSVRWEKDESDTGNIFCGKASWSVLPDEAYKAIIEDKPGSILLDLWGLGVLCEKMFDEHPKLQAFVKRCKLEGYDWTTQREKILQLNKDKNESQESRLAYIQEFIDDFSAVLRTQFELNTSTLVPQEPVPCATRDICLTLTLSRGRLVDEDDKDNDIAYPCHCLQDVVLAAGEAFALGNNIVVFAMPDGASCKVFYEKEPAKVLSLCGDSITLPHGEQIQWIHTTEAQR